MASYRVYDEAANGSVGQDCGTYALHELPERLRQAIEANPTADEWSMPALSGGDTGEELSDLRIVITAV